jgi:hypothetical protein
MFVNKKRDIHRAGWRLAPDKHLRLCGQLSHRHAPKLPVAKVAFATAATALVLVEYPVDMNEQVVDEISDTVLLD